MREFNKYILTGIQMVSAVYLSCELEHSNNTYDAYQQMAIN